MNCYIAISPESREMFPVSHAGLEAAISAAHANGGRVERVRPSEYNEIVWSGEL